MKALPMKSIINPIIHPGMAMALSLFLLTPLQARGAEDTMLGTPACCHEMINQRQKMRDAFKAQDTDINDQVTKMNSAPEDKKVVLMANIITLMVEQRTVRDERRAEIEKRMMAHTQCHLNMSDDMSIKCHKFYGWVGMHDAPWDRE